MLEVSILLHIDGRGVSTETLENLYSEIAAEADHKSNQLLFATALRSRCLNGGSETESAIYAVLVFDQALVQLGSLAWGVSRNKVKNPRDAAILAAYAGNWAVRQIARAKQQAGDVSPQSQTTQTSASGNSR